MKDNNAYILGTDKEELHRLGLQHQVWASEAQKGWENAGFTAGQTLLDLGCGPGFCTKEMAFVVGHTGKVIGIDRSEHFIKFLDAINSQYGLNIETQHADFNDMRLEDNSLDGMYCRWAMAWIPNVKDILGKVKKALKPGGKMVYATCSILPSENQEQIEHFLTTEQGKSFTFVKDKKILAHESGFDGFYMALLHRNN